MEIHSNILLKHQLTSHYYMEGETQMVHHRLTCNDKLIYEERYNSSTTSGVLHGLLCQIISMSSPDNKLVIK